MNNILIKVENLVKTFGGLVALNDCSLEIKDKAITGIIGPNGSGKTTFLHELFECYHTTKEMNSPNTFLFSFLVFNDLANAVLI